MIICLERGADCLLMPLHPQAPLSLASFKSRLVIIIMIIILLFIYYATKEAQ